MITRAFKVTLETTTGWEDYTTYADTPQAAEIAAVTLYRMQHPQERIIRALRNGSMTSAAYTAPPGIDWR
ncbi:hypothetical protein [Streptomyces sp. NPDC048659]|uniref:hypothetical protein n=1 Tax=Streptomyces sp. NPDC048659 TaxID=3155489 RepID=UPI003415821C